MSNVIQFSARKAQTENSFYTMNKALREVSKRLHADADSLLTDATRENVDRVMRNTLSLFAWFNEHADKL